MTTHAGARDPRPRRSLVAATVGFVVAFALGVLTSWFNAVPASAATATVTQNVVGVSTAAVAPLVGSAGDVSPATHLETYDSQAQIVSATGVAANTPAGGARAAGTNSVEILQDPGAIEGLTASQIDDLAVNAGYDILPGKAGAANPATRYYVPGTNDSTGFRVLPNGVAGQTGIKGGPYLRFFGGPNNGLRIPLSAS